MKANGRATTIAEKPPASEDTYVAAQIADLSETQRAYKDAESWRRVASGAMLALLASLVVCIVLALKYQHDVLVYRDTAHGLSYESEANQTRTPSQAAVEAQLISFVKAVRNVPGLDTTLIDENTTEAFAIAVDVSPFHAHQDLTAYFSDPSNNPKLLSKAGTVRTVLDSAITASPITAQTWLVSWLEELKMVNHKPILSPHTGTITIAPSPQIPTDPQLAAIDPAGVAVVQFEIHI